MDLVEKFRIIEGQISRERGDFSFFGLFEHDDVPGKWDVLVSAPWLPRNRSGIQMIVDALVPDVSQDEWRQIASIIPLDSNSHYVRWITENYHAQHALEEVSHALFDGVYISHGYIITADAHPAPLQEYRLAAG